MKSLIANRTNPVAALLTVYRRHERTDQSHGPSLAAQVVVISGAYRQAVRQTIDYPNPQRRRTAITQGPDVAALFNLRLGIRPCQRVDANRPCGLQESQGGYAAAEGNRFVPGWRPRDVEFRPVALYQTVGRGRGGNRRRVDLVIKFNAPNAAKLLFTATAYFG